MDDTLDVWWYKNKAWATKSLPRRVQGVLRRGRIVVAVSVVLPHLASAPPPYAPGVVEEWTRQVIDECGESPPHDWSDHEDERTAVRTAEYRAHEMLVFLFSPHPDAAWRDVETRVRQAAAWHIQHLGEAAAQSPLLARRSVTYGRLVVFDTGGVRSYALQWNTAERRVDERVWDEAEGTQRETLHVQAMRHLVHPTPTLPNAGYALVDVRGLSHDDTTSLVYALVLNGFASGSKGGVMRNTVVRYGDTVYYDLQTLGLLMRDVMLPLSDSGDKKAVTLFYIARAVFLARLARFATNRGARRLLEAMLCRPEVSSVVCRLYVHAYWVTCRWDHVSYAHLLEEETKSPASSLDAIEAFARSDLEQLLVGWTCVSPIHHVSPADIHPRHDVHPDGPSVVTLAISTDSAH